MYERLLRTLLFKLDPERAHGLAMSVLGIVEHFELLRRTVDLQPRDPILESRVFGLDFAGPLGLAAGFDKNATRPRALAALGFSHVEVGTITGQQQPGNPKPRLFRLQRDEALVNRMGFNNDGLAHIKARLKAVNLPVPVGANIGKSRVVSLDRAHDEYAQLAEALAPYVSYIVINISSPNTPGLRTLQDEASLRRVIRAVQDAMQRSRRVPLAVKIAPDLTTEAIRRVVDVVVEMGVDGIVAVNTSVYRGGLASSEREIEKIGPGGLSGRPLRRRACAITAMIHRHLGGTVPVVGVGGIASGADAYERIRAGASLVQTYTGFIYGGPLTAWRIQAELAGLLRRDGYRNVAEAVGRDADTASEPVW